MTREYVPERMGAARARDDDATTTTTTATTRRSDGRGRRASDVRDDARAVESDGELGMLR